VQKLAGAAFADAALFKFGEETIFIPFNEAARACNIRSNDHLAAAAIIEFIHTATLLHDDVVDSSGLRRGQETANSLFGNQASVLVGDFLYSRSFQMMVELKELRILEVLANATNTIAEGEVLQLMNCNDPDTTEKQYLDVIHRKTAKLFEAAAQIGAVLAGSDEATERAMADYGVHLGTAFQLIDDALDYSGDQATIGKQLGDDLAEGKPTLPLIFVMREGSLTDMIFASMAIPGVFTPVEIDGKLLVDGGVSKNLPVDVVQAMGADIVIAGRTTDAAVVCGPAAWHHGSWPCASSTRTIPWDCVAPIASCGARSTCPAASCRCCSTTSIMRSGWRARTTSGSVPTGTAWRACRGAWKT